jgi:hypothetical protein
MVKPKMVNQPTPKVTQEDVLRIVRRDFSESRFTEVMATLGRYENPNPYRVMLAALKLADGKIDKLRRQIDSAKIDFRDVIAAAEYPGYADNWSRINKMAPQEKQKIIGQDWQQYQEWLNRR